MVQSSSPVYSSQKTAVLQKQKKKNRPRELTGTLVKLLQGFILSDDKKYWDALLVHQETVQDYFALLGLRLHLSLEEGYAFLKPLSAGMEGEASEEENSLTDTNSKEALDSDYPSLVRKMPLSFEVSFLCVLLRESLEQFDSRVSDDHRLILKRVEIYELLKFFYDEKNDETKQVKRFDAMVNKVVELGFLRPLKGSDSFEVCRIIKAQLDADKLSEMKAQMMTELKKERTLE